MMTARNSHAIHRTLASIRQLAFSIAMVAAILCTPIAFAAELDSADSLRAIAAADGTVSVDQAASNAAKRLESLPSSKITDVLAGFDGATKRGRNWLRAVAADVSDNGPFQQEVLTSFFNDRSGDADARYVAFQLLTQHDSDLHSQLLENAATDPSLPVRYLKIQSMIDQAVSVMQTKPAEAIKTFRSVVANGRTPQQLQKAAKLLAELDIKIELANELGMIRTWWLAGPFDNTDSQEFDTAYLPENRYLESGSPIGRDSDGKPLSEQGKDRAADWQKIQSDDNMGMVDLNGSLANEKDAAAYLYCKFKIDAGSPKLPAQSRIGCITASKVWVNGKLVSTNEVYHSGTRIDQYVDDIELLDGENTVLIKVMQNAQTESWAQVWEFQFRLTRRDGSAIKTTWME